MKTVIETQRTYLRQWEREDLDAYYKIISDPLVLKYLPINYITYDQVRDKIEARLEQHREHGFCMWAVIFKENNELIGHSGLQYITGTQDIEVGYAFSPKYWGMGLATETAKAALEYGFNELKIKTIVGLAVPENKASRGVLEKIGLKFVGPTDKYYNLKGLMMYSS
jgi:[ribosomal protein S5]-alanine N-acetyltransferase